MSLDDVPADGPRSDLREITDATTMRALAHPVRIALLETLHLGGAMTATEVGERIGESSTTCSFHLRQLAKYGFVEEAGGGKGRARPWRLTSIGIGFGSSGDDPEVEIAASAAMKLFRDRQLDRYRAWRETRNAYPARWRDAANDSQYLVHLTAAELEQLNSDIHALILPRYRDRIDNPKTRPANSVPVEMLLFSYPIEMPDPAEDAE